MKSLLFFLIILFMSCSLQKHDEEVSRLMPKEFNLYLQHQKEYEVPTKVKVYTFKRNINDLNAINDFPVELKEEGWSFKQWHIVNDKEEQDYLLAMLDLSQYPIKVNNRHNSYTDLVSSIKESIENKKSYVSYYFKKKDKIDFYKNGYIEFYCLQPFQKRIIYLSFGDF